MKNAMVVSAVLLACACSKKVDAPAPTGDDKSAPKLVDGTKPPALTDTKPADPKATPGSAAGSAAAPTAGADITITSKSPEAIAAFTTARDLVINSRGPEAVEGFQKALALDPDFALAHAYNGLLMQGSAGDPEIAKAVELSAKLPEAEKTFIASMAAFQTGDTAKGAALLQKVVELAPGCWIADLTLANVDSANNDPASAIKALNHALSFNASLPTIQNGLAYAHATLREWDPAIAAAKKQVELLPKEPNPEDSLGEIQLMSGKFDDAEQSFQAAIKLDPKFTIAWQGIAFARAYRGDFKGAAEANAHREASDAPGDKDAALQDTAWLAVADNQLPKALAALDAIDADPAAKTLPVYANAQLERVFLLLHSGKLADAAKALPAAQARIDALPPALKTGLLPTLAMTQLRLAALQGKPAADADKYVATVEDAAKADPSNRRLQASVAYAHGLAVWTKSGQKDAVAELSKCGVIDTMCRLDLAAAQRKSGDAAGADTTLKALQDTPQRFSGVVAMRQAAIAQLGKK